MVNKISGIYAIVNKINGHRYIGSAANISKRWRTHKELLRKEKHHSVHLQRAWLKYGETCFEFTVIEQCLISELIIREQHFINSFQPEYNISPTAGSCQGIKVSEETRQKLSVIRRGKNNSMYGKHHTPITRQKISEINKGCTPWNKGRIGVQLATAKTRAKMSSSHLGKTWKNSVPAWNKGKPSLFSGSKHPKSKKVIQYSIDMIFIAEYASAGEASRATSVGQPDICKCCNEKRQFAGCFIWHYSEGSQ